MKVSELIGVDLDWWVAKVEGVIVSRERVCCGRGEQSSYDEPPECCAQPDEVLAIEDGMFPCNEWAPSRNWSQGGPIFEREGFGICKFYEPTDGPIPEGNEWCALWRDDSKRADGPTPLIAGMRLFVMSKYGDEVPAAGEEE
jgi:hypothetical protein